jgi:putative ABC transport system permease protein
MMRPRWKKVLADLWGNLTRSALVVASITVGLLAIGIITTIHYVITQDMRTGYQAINPANLFVSAGLYDKGYLDHLEHVSGVRQAEGSREVSLRLESNPGEWIGIRLKSTPDLSQLSVNQVHLQQGIWPPEDHQIVIESSKLYKTNASLGDFVTIETPSGKTRQLQIVGVVYDQSVGAGSSGTSGFFTAPVQGYITQKTLEWLETPLPYLLNNVYVTVTGDSRDPKYLDAEANVVTEDMKKNGLTVNSTTTRSSFDHPNNTLVQAISSLLFVLGLLVVFLSGFLITNTLQALLDQQMTQIGIMKTVGGRRFQISFVYMAFILVLGLLAFAIAVPVAYQVSFRLMDFLSVKLNMVVQGHRLIPQVVAIQGALALLVPQVAAFLPIWQGSGLSVKEALSGSARNVTASNGWLDHQLARIRWLSRPMRISVRNVFRRKGRLILTLITLTMGGAVFIATFNVRVSMNQYVAQISHYFRADVNLTLNRPYRIAEIDQMLSGLPGIGRVEGWAGARAEMVLADGTSGESVSMLAPPANSDLVKPIILKGRWIEPGDQNAIVLNDLFMTEYPQINIGDSLPLKVNGDDKNFVVVGFFRFAGKVAGLLAYTNYDYLSELINQPNQAASFRIVADRKGMNNDQQLALAKTIEARLRIYNVDINDVTTGFDMSSTAADGFNVLTGFLLFLASLTALVGSIGLAGTMSMNVMERTREIGVMRAIGASNRILMNMVIVEGSLIGIISWILGCLLAFPMSKILSDTVSQAIFNSPSNFALTPIGFIIWLATVIVLSVLASVMPARNASRLTIREVLAYE